jgi:hypothetical protein
MSRLSDVAAGANENAIGTLDHKHLRMAATIHVLFVGPVDRGSMVHDALLDGANFRLTITTDYRELWGMPTQESIQVAILYNTLSSFELEAASRLIRRRWPHSSILVVSRGKSFLEGALYDDRVEPTVAPLVLQTTIERLQKGCMNGSLEMLRCSVRTPAVTGTAAVPLAP